MWEREGKESLERVKKLNLLGEDGWHDIYRKKEKEYKKRINGKTTKVRRPFEKNKD